MNAKSVRKIITILLMALLLGGLLVLSSTSVAAQGRYHRRVIIVRPIDPFRRFDPFWNPYGRFNRRDYYNEYVFSNSRKAYDQGYKDGLKTGRNDGRKDKSFDPERSHYFHDAGFGNYAAAYRDGFSVGYREGFSAAGIG
jgi:hypothetical protein